MLYEIVNSSTKWIRLFKYKFLMFASFVAFLVTKKQRVYAQQNVNDTILSYAVIYNGDTIEAKTLPALGLSIQGLRKNK